MAQCSNKKLTVKLSVCVCSIQCFIFIAAPGCVGSPVASLAAVRCVAPFKSLFTSSHHNLFTLVLSKCYRTICHVVSRRVMLFHRFG